MVQCCPRQCPILFCQVREICGKIQIWFRIDGFRHLLLLGKQSLVAFSGNHEGCQMQKEFLMNKNCTNILKFSMLVSMVVYLKKIQGSALTKLELSYHWWCSCQSVNMYLYYKNLLDINQKLLEDCHFLHSRKLLSFFLKKMKIMFR